MRKLLAAVLIAAAVAACGTPATTATTATPATGAVSVDRPPAEPPMSDPAEYAIDRVSWQAGEVIFARTGIGDPYRTGVPYPIYLALLRQYPDLFGADTQAVAARFGFIARPADPASPDRDVREGLPLGLHLTDDPFTGVPFVVHNCALCHAERVRWPGGETLVVGLGNKRVRIHDYDAAFSAAAGRADFDVATLAPLAEAAAAERGIAWPLDWRTTLVKATIAAIEQRRRDRKAYLGRVAGGPPGRVAHIEAFALAIGAALDRDIATAPVVGWSKVPDVVGFGARTTLSWDGAGEGPMDVLVVEADFAAGVRPAWFWAHPLQGASLGAYLRQPERELPFPGPIDRKLAARGRALFDDNCAPCHGTYGDDGRVRRYDEQIVPLADVGTDPARADAITDDFVTAANDHTLTHGITRTRRTGGYVPPVLTDVWARAPYGHAGQWPSLAVMATPPTKRPLQIVLQLDALYDLKAVGVSTRAPGAPLAAGEYLHDAGKPGLGVQGHPFLADLGADAAAAVIEYLKSL